MKKLRTTILCKACLFLTLLLIGGAVVAQTNYTTLNDYTGNWTDNGSWDGETALGTTLGSTEAFNVKIYGEITVDNLVVDGNENVNIIVYDTLIITGNLSVNTHLVLHVESTGYLIIRGNFLINSGGEANFNVVNDGFLGIKTNYTNLGTESGTSNSTRNYVLGTENKTQITFGNLSDLVNKETPSTRKLLFGDVAINAIITPVSPTCNGDKNGSITVEGTGGVGNYRYQFNNTNWASNPGWTAYTSSPYTTPDTLSPGTYTVNVEDDFGDTHSAPTSIAEKPELTLSVNGDLYFCPSATTEFTVTVSGGNPDYTVSVSGQPDRTEAGPDFVYSGLASGTYTINVSDAEGCPQPAAETFTVNIDNAPPVVDVFPPDVFISYAAFTGGSTLNTNEVMSGPSSNTFTSTSNFDSNSMNLSNYENGRYSFDVAQSGATPAAGDIIEVQKRTDGGSTFSTPLATYAGEQSGTLSGNINLSDDPAENASVVIRLSVTIATSGLQYDVSGFQVIADERINSETYNSGTATYTDDPSGVASVESDDLAADWYCTAAGNEELTVTRRWRATDDCGNTSTWQPQVIHVGTAPTITVGNDTIIDFCNAGNISLPTPEVDDNCPPTGGLDITWEIFNQESSLVQDGSAPLSGISLPYSNTNDSVYTVTWTVTDQAGFTATASQTLTIKPAINIELINGPYDFCSGEQVVFDVSITGGTGVFGDPTFSIGGTWSGNANNTSGTFTTTNPSELGFEPGMGTSFIGYVTDENVTTPETITGGCNSDPIINIFSDGADFDVHENILTNPINRVE